MHRSDAVLRAAAGVRFTGAVARIESRGAVIFERAYGVTRGDALAQTVYVDTRFDLASLTKLFVATRALQAVAEGRISLDGPLVRWVPEWRGRPHEAITLRMLLAHTSGMNSGADYRRLFAENIERFALERELVAQPGERVIYSDLGFIALGVLLARLYGRSLAVLCPGFRPRSWERLYIPATEEDNWRGRVQGVVHDEKAYLMNGVAGHAGLFGTAADVAGLAELYLDALRKPLEGGEGSPERLAFQELLGMAVSEQAYDPVLRRGLGWTLKTLDGNSCGRYFSSESFGHTGFVGTCVWADPVNDVQAVLLTNGVYFGRNDTREFRIAFYEAVMKDLGCSVLSNGSGTQASR